MILVLSLISICWDYIYSNYIILKINPCIDAFPLRHIRHIFLIITEQDYYGRRCGTLLHSYCTSTYTEITTLLLWSSSNTTLEYPHRYSNRVAVWVLHGTAELPNKSSTVMLQWRYHYSNCVIRYHIAGHRFVV